MYITTLYSVCFLMFDICVIALISICTSIYPGIPRRKEHFEANNTNTATMPIDSFSDFIDAF